LERGKRKNRFRTGVTSFLRFDSVLAVGFVEVLLAVVEEKRKEARRGVMGK
jgi:hypothetical protein